jgi:hypothetical protein
MLQARTQQIEAPQADRDMISSHIALPQGCSPQRASEEIVAPRRKNDKRRRASCSGRVHLASSSEKREHSLSIRQASRIADNLMARARTKTSACIAAVFSGWLVLASSAFAQISDGVVKIGVLSNQAVGADASKEAFRPPSEGGCSLAQLQQ